MAALDEQLIAFLRAQATVNVIAGNRIHEGNVPESSDDPYVWIQRSMRDRESYQTLQKETHPLSETLYDIECIAVAIADSQNLADAVRGVLDEYRGEFASGQGLIQGVFVDDHTDDYLPRGVGDDSGLNVVALRVAVFQGA